jgi:hypothetical protein
MMTFVAFANMMRMRSAMVMSHGIVVLGRV